MNIVERSKVILLDLGASPILYLMIALSVASIAVMLERALLFIRLRENLEQLGQRLAGLLDVGDVASARDLVLSRKSPEAAIVAAGLVRFGDGAHAVEDAMAAATAVQRMRLERRLGYLGTLGSNAPFVGLLGTVIGIVQAFEQLQLAGSANGGGGGAMSGVMGAIAEALVATAIGLIVAIPAVAAFNAFQRRIKTILGNAEALRHVVLSYAKSASAPAQAAIAHSESRAASPVLTFSDLRESTAR